MVVNVADNILSLIFMKLLALFASSGICHLRKVYSFVRPQSRRIGIY